MSELGIKGSSVQGLRSRFLRALCAGLMCKSLSWRHCTLIECKRTAESVVPLLKVHGTDIRLRQGKWKSSGRYFYGHPTHCTI